MRWIRWFTEVGLGDVAIVGGKNASLGEMTRQLSSLGVQVPPGFALTADAFREFLRANRLEASLRELLSDVKPGDVEVLVRRCEAARALVRAQPLPDEIALAAITAYRALSKRCGAEATDVAVRSSATAEDLPEASFAGQQDTFLNVQGEEALLDAIRACYASLYTARAVSYRNDFGFSHTDVALSVGIQKMVRSDLGASGVLFTLDPESGHRDIALVTSSWGLGEAVVQGKVVPDQFYVHKPLVQKGFPAIVWKGLGTKEEQMIYDTGSQARVALVPVPEDKRRQPSLTDDDVLTLAKWGMQIEAHYAKERGESSPVDVEWAKDGQTGELFIVQARPETVHSRRSGAQLTVYTLTGQGPVLTKGLAVGSAIATGTARVIRDPSQIGLFQKGEILVTEATDPDWEPIMKMAAGIVTERGGRTSHAAIVARELGIPAVLGTGDATRAIQPGQAVTLSCAEGEQGRIYAGTLPFETQQIDLKTLERPRTQMMLNVGSPEQAFHAAQLPNDGVGLARMEFIFANWVRVHPLALLNYATLSPEARAQVDEVTRGYEDKTRYFIDKLSQGIATIAAAFWPKPVILRLSDFKSNEYAALVGGQQFEPHEENPMLGWRGASRYYHPAYKAGFLLEVEAIRQARDVMGLDNLKVMVPFCRTPDEGRKVLEVLREGGLERGKNGLEVYVMAELPSNVFLADEYAQLFDGFSIGSNDLTQLVLGVDRDSALVAPLFDERNRAVKEACTRIIQSAKAKGRKVGICGQAPSDFPDFAQFLVEQGIDSISLTPDAIVKTTERVLEVERTLAQQQRSASVHPLYPAAANTDGTGEALDA